MRLMPGFDTHPAEGALIGRLVAGYGELEYDLALCVSQIVDDFDSTMKAVFRIRGETNRIDIADALGRDRVPPGSEQAFFDETIKAMRHCLAIRNQYAHSNWINTGSGLRFVFIEDGVKDPTQPVSAATLKQYTASLPLLKKQVLYFEYTLDSLAYLNFEGQFRRGNISNQLRRPQPLPLPKPAKR